MRSTYETILLERQFSRRALLIGGTQLGLLGTLFARLSYLGSYRGADYKTLSDKNRIKIQYVLPKRGLIKDRNNLIIAQNKPGYRLMVLQSLCINLQQACLALQKIFPLQDTEIKNTLELIKYKPKFIPSVVKNNLTWNEVSQLEVVLRDFPCFFIAQVWTRVYNHPYALSHVIGYVNKTSKQKLPGYLADLKVGTTGIEEKFEHIIQGKVGYDRIEIDAQGIKVRNLEKKAAIKGVNQKLSIDLTLQKFVQQRLSQEKSASCIVMHAHSGKILALNSHPSFNSNVVSNNMQLDQWQSILNNPYNCLANKVISGLYPPGSIFKIVVALAALQAGISSKHTSICKGYITLGKHNFYCWHKHGGHGKVDIIRALRESCDVYFYEIAKKIGIENIAKTAAEFGFGRKSGIEISGEKSGLVPNKDWKYSNKGEFWQTGDTLNIGIGQGALLVTPIQMAVMMASIVNNKKIVTPSLLFSNNNNELKLQQVDISTKYLNIIRQGLNAAINDRCGTGYYNRIQDNNWAMAGKTSTTQVSRISIQERKNGVRKNEQRIWKLRDHSMFVGYAPVYNPKYVITVVIEHGGSGSRKAVPIARDILLKTQQII